MKTTERKKMDTKKIILVVIKYIHTAMAKISVRK